MAYRKDLERTAAAMMKVKNPLQSEESLASKVGKAAGEAFSTPVGMQKAATPKTPVIEMQKIEAKPITQDISSKNYISLSERGGTGLNRPMKPQEAAFPGLNKAVGKVKMAGINIAKKVSNIKPEGVADKARRIFTPNTQVDRYMDPGKANITSKSDIGDKKVITKYDRFGDVKKVKTITKVSSEKNEGDLAKKAYTGVKRIDVVKPGKYGDDPMPRSRYKKTKTFSNVFTNIGRGLIKTGGSLVIGDTIKTLIKNR